MSKLLKEGAIFVADAHYPHHGDEFLKLLRALELKQLQPPQLILMGDIFDLLFGHNNYIKTFSKEAIELLQTLSETIDIVYLEGNHDFCLKDIFPNIKVYSREQQPLHFRLNGKNVYLSHGDKYETNLGYDLYSKLIRNATLLKLLRPFQKPIIETQMAKLKKKEICKPFENYQARFDAILTHYPQESLVIEGHFHQGLTYRNYISLPSLACHKKIAKIEKGHIVFELLT